MQDDGRLTPTLELLRYERLGSTNTKAFRLAEKGAREWTVVVSDVQTRGRGRAGKAWVSPRGGLWLSVILRPTLNVSKVGRLQLLAAVSARRAIEKQSGLIVELKWPNDLVLSGGKLGGILVETKLVSDVVSFAVLGIGINVNQLQKSLPEGAVSLLTTTGRRWSLRKLLGAILDELRHDYSRIQDASGLVSKWWDHCVHKLKTVQVETSRGVVTGMSAGLSDDGSLLVETGPGQIVNVADGTLRARRVKTLFSERPRESEEPDRVVIQYRSFLTLGQEIRRIN